MKRVRLWVSYDGTEYSGWQIQPGVPTIEGKLDEAIQNLIGEDIHVIGASRTDAGVHGLCNVAVFDTEHPMPADRYAFALNSFLPDDIVVFASDEVAPDWHPRHVDGTRKTYEYRITRTRHENPLTNRYSAHYYGPLDVDQMRAAAKLLCGTHDYTSFCAAATVVTDRVRTVFDITIDTPDDATMVFHVTGNGFLYNMVRIIVGTLLSVGRGELKPDDMSGILAACDRTKAGPTAPAKGLTLFRIEYPENGK